MFHRVGAPMTPSIERAGFSNPRDAVSAPAAQAETKSAVAHTPRLSRRGGSLVRDLSEESAAFLIKENGATSLASELEKEPNRIRRHPSPADYFGFRMLSINPQRSHEVEESPRQTARSPRVRGDLLLENNQRQRMEDNMAKARRQRKIRIQLDFVQDAHDELLQLQEDTGAPSKIETVRYGLRTLRWVNETLKGGGTISVDNNGVRQQVVFPFLSPSSRKPEVVTV